MEIARKRHIRLNGEEIEYMNLLVNVANAIPKDCFSDGNTVVFIVEGSKIGATIGKEGKNAGKLRKILNKNVEILEYGESPEQFIRNAFKGKKIEGVEIQGDSLEIQLGPEEKSAALQNPARIRRLKKALERNYRIKSFRIK